jgi:HlyD family secretion protein
MTATITTASNTGRGGRAVPWWRSWPALTGVAVVALALGVWGFSGAAGGDGLGGDSPIFVTERGPLTIHVTESGTIQAREQVVLKSEVEGQTTIIWIIEEGKYVEAGELLVELDGSKLDDSLVDQQIRVQNAEASYIRARESLEITRSKGESDVARAELDYEFAQEDLKKYVEGEYPKQHKEMVSKIALAKGDLEDTANTAQWSKRLYDEKYIALADLTRDELRLERAKLDLETAQADLSLLEEFTYKRRVRELESDVDQTEMALGRVKRQALANIVQDEADLKAKESELKRHKERLAKIEDQIQKTRIYSPAAGMVIYATTGQDSRRGNDEPLEAGRAVREREEIIHLPTANSVLVNIKVHESSLKKVQIGQPVRITINALPGKEYFGTVARIAPLPDAQSFWRGNPDLKVYNTEIHLDGELDGVRTGMTCKAEVIVQQLRDVISVPIWAVVKIGSQSTVYVKRGGRTEPVAVELGMDNKDRVHVISGLSEGDKVLTNPPLQDTDITSGIEDVTDPGSEGDAKSTDRVTAAPGSNTPSQPGGQASKPGAPDTVQPGKPSAEQNEQMRERMKNMTPEQREAMRKRMREQQPGQRGNHAGAQDQQK